ncbi:MAG: lysoplasmalogenase family protein [Candidatus Izemoplasmatales bacterium]
MTNIIISMIAAAIVLFVFLYYEWKERYLHAFFFKGLSSLFFFIFLLMSFLFYLLEPRVTLSIITYERFFVYIGIGLGFGFLGDLVLALRSLLPKDKNNKIIMLGTMSFLFGHLFYIRAMIEYIPFSWYPLFFSVVVTTLIFLFAKKIHTKFGTLLIPSVVYSFILFFFVGQILFGFSHLTDAPFRITILIGSILFAVSDLILSQIYYNNKETKGFKTLNLVTYYLAQYLIALSLFFMVI